MFCLSNFRFLELRTEFGPKDERHIKYHAALYKTVFELILRSKLRCKKLETQFFFCIIWPGADIANKRLQSTETVTTMTLAHGSMWIVLQKINWKHQPGSNFWSLLLPNSSFSKFCQTFFFSTSIIHPWGRQWQETGDRVSRMWGGCRHGVLSLMTVARLWVTSGTNGLICLLFVTWDRRQETRGTQADRRHRDCSAFYWQESVSRWPQQSGEIDSN